jgi:hypothetical protein
MDIIHESMKWYQGLQHHIVNSPNLSILRDFLPTRPEDLNDYSFARNMHLNFRKGLIFSYDPFLKQEVLRAIDEYIKQDLGIASFDKTKNPAQDKRLNNLKTKGYTQLSHLPAEKAAVMRAYFENNKVLSKDNQLIDLAHAADTEQLGYYPVKTILLCPYLLEMLADIETLSLVEDYLGTVPTTIVMAAWWSFAGKKSAQEAQLFHFDGDDYRFCKLFLYLTDVSLDAGPHCYVEGTHRMDEVLQARSRWLDNDKFDKFYFGQFRKSDEEVRDGFQKDFTYITGPAGSRFIVDTSGLHKGLLPNKHHRLLLQITYGIGPEIVDGHATLELRPGTREHIAMMTNSVIRYVNRFFIDEE